MAAAGAAGQPPVQQPPARDPVASGSATGPGWRPTLGDGAQSAAGFLLGLFVWGWLIMPLINGGPTRVRDTLRAKFLNKGPDGSWLP